jgi:signal recognition particle GTPase
MNPTTTSLNKSGFQKAQKVVKNARIGLCGVAGSGKTFTALKIAGDWANESP